MNNPVKYIVEDFFSNANISNKKIMPSISKAIYDNINIGDPLYFDTNGFTLISKYKHINMIGRCIIPASQSIYKRPVFIANKDLTENDAELFSFSAQPRKEYFKFSYALHPNEDFNGWQNTEELFNHPIGKDNILYGIQTGFLTKDAVHMIKQFHKNAYLASSGEWMIAKKTIEANKDLFIDINIDKHNYFWTSSMMAYNVVWYMIWDGLEDKPKWCRHNDIKCRYFMSTGPYNQFRLRPFILL